MKNLIIFGKEIIDENSIKQIGNCITSDEDIAVLTADAHYGYGHPIGGAIAYKDKLSISGVGFDIGCGNKAVKTDIKAEDIDAAKIMDEIFRRISFGVGRVNNEPIDHPIIDKIRNADFMPQRTLIQLAENQLGTVGSGNHYVDLFEDRDGYVWIGVHFGSRGFGHKTAMGFLAMSQGLKFTDKCGEGSMDAPPILLSTKESIGQEYWEAMRLAGEYAYAGRDVVVNKVLEILGAKTTFEVHNHHNFTWVEEHFGEEYFVVRKGCTPAFPGQYGFIGSTMADISVIVKGVDSEVSKKGLYSTVHGAGRVMSRMEAKGRGKWINVDGKRVWVEKSKGKVDFEKTKERMKNRIIELRGGGADESPECYKKLTEVLDYHKGTIEVVETLRPIGVAMAGSDTFDPYKD